MTDFDELARSLRQGVGREVREEAAEDERLTELQRRRHATLSDVATTALHRGDRLSATVGSLRLIGIPVEVGQDFVTLAVGQDIADVHLGRVALTVDRATQGGGRAVTSGSQTFRARLAELEADAVTVELVSASGAERWRGRIEVVAADHVVVADGEGDALYVSMDVIGAVIRAGTGRGRRH